mmetsp:Transcript_9407/g.28362  ORF Transcript_9407/g.28362 Transcript_9407/m.28362 type:complete len:134 (+) Transcript_9407:1126-1527(+)
MRIITHNFLQCPRTKSYPLRLVATEVETVETEYSGAFIHKMLQRLDWSALRQAAEQLQMDALPEAPPSSEEEAPEVFQQLHTLLLETHVKTGSLVGDDGTSYEIKNYIPNMMTTGSGPVSTAEPNLQAEAMET